VDASSGLVCVVAGLANWMCPVGILHVLIIFYIYGITLSITDSLQINANTMTIGLMQAGTTLFIHYR
jgi:hypothetical protein